MRHSLTATLLTTWLAVFTVTRVTFTIWVTTHNILLLVLNNIYAVNVEPEPDTIVATYGPATASPTLAIPIPSANDTPDADTIVLTCPHPGST